MKALELDPKSIRIALSFRVEDASALTTVPVPASSNSTSSMKYSTFSVRSRI